MTCEPLGLILNLKLVLADDPQRKAGGIVEFFAQLSHRIHDLFELPSQSLDLFCEVVEFFSRQVAGDFTQTLAHGVTELDLTFQFFDHPVHHTRDLGDTSSLCGNVARRPFEDLRGSFPPLPFTGRLRLRGLVEQILGAGLENLGADRSAFS